MFIKSSNDCPEFIANDGCHIRELLHPKNDAVELPYSIALARVDVGKHTYKHRLTQQEIYIILDGEGLMHIDEQISTVKSGDIIVVPAKTVQWIENSSSAELIFYALVNPPWSEAGDQRLD